MQRQRVVDFRPDFSSREEFAQLVPAPNANHILMKHMFGLRTLREQAHRRAVFVRTLFGTAPRSQPGAGEQLVVGRGVPLPPLVPFRDVWQLHAQHRGLNSVHASVPAKFVVIVAPRTAVVAELSHALGHLRTGRGDNSRVPVGAQVFGGIETEGGGYTERARSTPAPLGANRLRGVFDDGNREFLGVFLNDAVECVHVGALAVKMYGKNRTKIFGSLRLDLPYNERGIQIQRAGIDVDEDWRRARPHNCARRGKEAEGGGDDRVPGLYASGNERQPERLRSGRATDGAGRSCQRGNLTLKRLDLGTENEALRIAHTRDGGQHFFADAIVLASQVKQRNGLGRGVW